MSWFSNPFTRRKLTTTDRNLIYKLFGSFGANSFDSNPTDYLQYGYEKNIDVYSVIRKIIEAYKNGYIVIEEQDREGNWQEIEDSTLHELIESPNKGKGYTWNDIEEQLLVYLLATGNSYMIGETGLGSMVAEVDVLPSFAVEPQTNTNFFLPEIKYKFQFGTNNRTYAKDEIDHIRYFNPLYHSTQDSIVGMSPIQVAAQAVMVGNDRWEADAALLQNRGAIGLITDKSKLDGRPMTEPEAKAVQLAFDRDTAGTHNYGKVKVTNKNLDFVQMAMSSTDLQLIEKGVVNLRAICNVFGLDSSLFNDPGNKTYNNRLEAEKAMYTNVVIPIADKINVHYDNFLVKNHFKGRKVRIRRDFSEVEALQKDKKSEAEKDKIVMEGISIVLAMPISNEAKKAILLDQYELPEDMADLMTKDNDTV